MGTLALGTENVVFSSDSLCTTDWLKVSLSPDDIYQLKFYNGNHCNNLIISSTDWAIFTDANSNKPIIHKIPDYISSEGYDRITVTPISGDGDYSIADFSLIVSMDAEKYPEHNIIAFEIKQFEIEIDKDDYEKIEQKRIDAIGVGILLTSDSDNVGVKIKSEGKKSDADLRLKGDWTDHLTEDQWSFRIDLSGDYCMYGLQKFSLQPIDSRNGIWEYLIYEMFREQGGVALRYDFADVFVNGVYKGVYAVEEFMSKRVIENSRKREGPIIKISEDFLWEHRAYCLNDELFAKVFDDDVEVFSEKKTATSSTLSSYAFYAINQLNMLRKGEIAVDEVLDIDLYARLHAILDIFSSYHGRIWHNTRNYFNPVTGLLEPIPFDEIAFSNTTSVLVDKSDYIDYFGFSQCDEYNALYLQYLRYLSQDYTNFIERHLDEISQYITTIRRYDSIFTMDSGAVSGRIQRLQAMFEDIAEPISEIYYDYSKDVYRLDIHNVNLLAIYITGIQNGFGDSDEYLTDILKIGENYKVNGVSASTIEIPATLDIDKLTNAKFVYHTVFSENRTSLIANGGIKLGFFTIGHAYGAPVDGADGMHEPVKAYLSKIMNNDYIAFGVFTGDIAYGTEEWEFSVFSETLNATGKEWYVAPGNHDALTPGYYDKHIKNKFGYFVKADNLFIYLDCAERWDIPDEQLEMIHTALSMNMGVENIFVFTHQLNWWDPDSADFEGFAPNSLDEYDSDNRPNFNSKVLPLFESISQDIYFVAGDTGAFANGCEIYYRKDGRFTYIASGVGGGNKDSAIEFYILENGEVSIRLIAINEKMQDALGRLTDYAWKSAQ